MPNIVKVMVLQWDWKDTFPPEEDLNKAVSTTFNGVNSPCFRYTDTGSDQFGLLVSSQEITPHQADAIWAKTLEAEIGPFVDCQTEGTEIDLDELPPEMPKVVPDLTYGKLLNILLQAQKMFPEKLDDPLIIRDKDGRIFPIKLLLRNKGDLPLSENHFYLSEE